MGEVKILYLIHTVSGVEYRTKISTLRGDLRRSDGTIGNTLRLWEKSDYKPGPGDIFQERLYAVHWMRPKPTGKKFDSEFRAVTSGDLKRERIVEDFIAKHLSNWQEKGLDSRHAVEPATTDEPIRTRGWTHLASSFSAKAPAANGILRRECHQGEEVLLLSRILDYTGQLCRWSTSKAGTGNEGGRTGGASDDPTNVFTGPNALNTFYNYGCRAAFHFLQLFSAPLPDDHVVLGAAKDVCCTQRPNFLLPRTSALQTLPTAMR